MEFWKSGSGASITGLPDMAFLKDFTVIPNGTTAVAKITSFTNVVKDNQYTGTQDKFLLINWKIQTGEFVSRDVTQKIKCFDGDAKQIDRNLNMLKLVMDLCGFKPTHSGAPTDDDLKYMHGKACGIKIREWSMPKADGSGIAEGNFVSEVHPATGFESETGIKVEHVSHAPNDSALQRNAKSKSGVEIDDDLPF